jgi:hypothetical protein
LVKIKHASKLRIAGLGRTLPHCGVRRVRRAGRSSTRSPRAEDLSRSQNAPRRRFAGFPLECEAADGLFEARRLVVREAVEGILRLLERFLPSETTDELRESVHHCWHEVEQWALSPPTDREQDVLMKRVLALHVAVTKLHRDALLAVVKGSVAAR